MPLKFKLMTYLVPDYPLEFFQTIQYYLEEKLHIPTSLCVESRQDGPTAKNNPILEGEADLIFMSSTAFLQMSKEKSTGIELLPAAAIFNHASSDQRPIYFSDIIIPKSREEMHKELVDLKGSRFAYDKEGSIGGEIPMLAKLKSKGYNANFFSHSTTTGSHRGSISMVLQGRAEVAAVDSIALEFYLKEHPEKREEISVMKSIGPIPVFAIAISSKLPDDMKSRLKELLLNMNSDVNWASRLRNLNLSGFKSIDASLYEMESTLRSRCEKVSMKAAYY